MTKLVNISLDELEKLAAAAPYSQPIKMMLALKRKKLHQAHLYQSDHIADTHLYAVIKEEAESIIEDLEVPEAVPMAPIVIESAKKEILPSETTPASSPSETAIEDPIHEEKAPLVEPEVHSTIQEDESPSIDEITEYTSTLIEKEDAVKSNIATTKKKKK